MRPGPAPAPAKTAVADLPTKPMVRRDLPVAPPPPVADPSLVEVSVSAVESSLSELSVSSLEADSVDADRSRQDASLLLSEDAIKQLKETAALPLPMDDSGLVLSDSAILQLGRAAVGPTVKKPEKNPDVLSPSGILRMAAGMQLGTAEGDATRADLATTEAVRKLTENPKLQPMRQPVGLSNLPTALLSPIAPPPEDRTSLDVAAPGGAKKNAPDDMAETAIRQLPGPITVHNPGPLPKGAAPIVSRPTSTGMVIVPAGGVLGGDIDLPPELTADATELKPSERRGVVTRKAESTVLLGEPPGGAPTQPPVEHDATAIRQVFQRFGPAEPRAKGRPAAVSEERASVSRSSVFPKLLVGLLAIGAVGAGGWFGTNWYLHQQQVRRLGSTARTNYEAAFEHGRLADFVQAEAQLRTLGEAVATDDAARQARALLLTAARFEFGGGPPIAADSDWEQESLGAVRLVETETGPLAQAALVFSALAQGDLTAAERHLELLQSANTGEGRYRLPNGMVDYLASQLALLAGREEQAVLALQRAVQKQRLPMWQRRLGYVLLRSGRDEEAIVALTAAQSRQEDLVGAQIDLAYARGRTGKPEQLAEANQVLQGLVEAPRGGPDPAGRSEHARAALWLADLTLRADPQARAAARELLAKAQSKALPTDVLFQEELAQARLHIGDGEPAAAIARELVTRLPQRRISRILLARALVAAKQGSDALTALGPLIEGKDKTAKAALDTEAQLLRAQALFLTHDTLAAQQVTRQVMAATPAGSAEHIGAQLLAGELFLKLGEPVSARRSLEPLVRQLDKAKAEGATDGAPKSTSETKASHDRRLHIQLLWARTLLAMRPPQQSEARSLLESVVATTPDNAEGHYLLGRLLRELGVLGPAEEQLTAAVRDDDHLTSARRELAGLLMLRGEFGKAHELYTGLLKEEKDSELLITAARAERLDGAPEKALTTLLNVHRQTGEIAGKFDEELLAERARALLLVERGGEVVNLLSGPTSDLGQLKKPTLAALLIRAHVSLAEGSQQKQELAAARALLGKLPKAMLPDFDVRLAEAELLRAEGKRSDATQVLNALVASLQTLPPTSSGEETALRQHAERLLEAKKN